jgi:hypothetical protein
MQQPETFSDYVRQFVEDRDIITTTKTHIDLAGDLSAGAVLEELVFWSAPNKNGQAKLRVKKDGKLWLAVPREEWWERRRLSPKQADRAIKILVGLGLMEKATYKFAGSPVVHICINEEGFMAALAKYRECKPASEGYKGRYRPEKPDSEGAESPFFPKGEIPFSPKGEIHFPQAGITYTVSTPVPTLQPLKERFMGRTSAHGQWMR